MTAPNSDRQARACRSLRKGARGRNCHAAEDRSQRHHQNGRGRHRRPHRPARCRGDGGLDAAIHRAAGPRLEAACAALGGCRTGEAKVTEGFDLPCKYIIHTVGPVWRGGRLRRKAAAGRLLPKRAGAGQRRTAAQSVAFPLISAATNGYPRAKALRVAVDAIAGVSAGKRDGGLHRRLHPRRGGGERKALPRRGAVHRRRLRGRALRRAPREAAAGGSRRSGRRLFRGHAVPRAVRPHDGHVHPRGDARPGGRELWQDRAAQDRRKGHDRRGMLQARQHRPAAVQQDQERARTTAPASRRRWPSPSPSG